MERPCKSWNRFCSRSQNVKQFEYMLQSCVWHADVERLSLSCDCLDARRTVRHLLSRLPCAHMQLAGSAGGQPHVPATLPEEYRPQCRRMGGYMGHKTDRSSLGSDHKNILCSAGIRTLSSDLPPVPAPKNCRKVDLLQFNSLFFRGPSI
jgi:hypothetical protein